MDSYQDLGFAKLDLSRVERTGIEETVFCKGKTSQQLVEIFTAFIKEGRSVLGTKCSFEQAEALRQAGIDIEYDLNSNIVISSKENSETFGDVAICCAGTADFQIAEEAAKTLEFFHVNVSRYYDIGVAGLHRLLSKIEMIKQSDIVIVVAGMEGALASVVTGLISSPVIAVPTSVGYGTAFHGITALLAMLNSCAEGMTVVNIDNGYGAAVAALRILKKK